MTRLRFARPSRATLVELAGILAFVAGLWFANAAARGPNHYIVDVIGTLAIAVGASAVVGVVGRTRR